MNSHEDVIFSSFVKNLKSCSILFVLNFSKIINIYMYINILYKINDELIENNNIQISIFKYLNLYF